MTLRLIEGFDHVGAAGSAIANVAAAGWTPAGTFQSGSQLLTGRWGVGRYPYMVGQNNNIQKLLPSGWPEVWAGMALAGGIRATAQWVLIRTSLGATCLSLTTTGNAGGAIELRNAAGTVVATSASTYAWDGGWHYVEIRCLAAGAAGSAEVWVDGVQIIPSTTSNYGVGGATTSPAGLLFQNYDLGGGTWYTTHVDDLYLLDTGTGSRTTRLGECRVETLWPTSDGAHTDFTPTTAGHFDEVDDPGLHDSDATTIQSNTVGHRDSFGFPDLSIASGTIHGVAVKTLARKNDAGLRQIKHSIRQGGTTYDGAATHSLTASHACYQTCWDQDPVAANWTVANVNGDEFGVKVEA